MWSDCKAVIILVHVFVTNSLGFVNLAHDQGLRGIMAMGAAPERPAWTASKAIDGNTNQSYLSDSCAITDVDRNRNTSIWWRVWLQKKFNVAYIEIYFRSDTYSRSTGFSIFTYIPQNFYPLSDPKNLVYHHDPMSGCPASVMNITVNNITQGIAFINTRPYGYTSNCPGDNTMYTGIEICEIRVMGCDASRYSIGCTQICPSKCNGGCDAFNGSCIHGCSNPNASSIDCIVCDDGEYITNKICVDCPGHCKDGAPCNKLTGMCDSGCANQWTGTFCNLCPANYYGRNCNTQCGHCKDNVVCNNITGHCPNGCQSQWQGDRCDECVDGFYNVSCTGKCGHCLYEELCNKVNGHCPSGCTSNFKAPLCQECGDGFYNLTCSGVCGHCVNGEFCLQNTGYCANGCSNHFLYPFCQECENRYYGNICRSVCGQCINGEMCDKYNGTCVNGCEPNFKTPLCQECLHGFYGQQCEKSCGKCKGGMICNTTSDMCPDGCQEHWSPPQCTECIPYKWGPNCAFDCGHCRDGMTCSTDTGVCTKGCEDGWTGDICLTVKTDAAESLKQSEEMPTTGTVAIAVLSTLLVIAILINIFTGRKLISNRSSKRHTDTPMSQKQDPSQTYTDLAVTDETHAYSTLGSDVREAPYQVISDASHKIK